MRVLFAHNFYTQPGGEDVVFQKEVELLRGYGHEVIEFVEDNKHLDALNPLQAAINAVWSQDTYRRMRALIRETKPDIAHFHNIFLRISPAAYHACKDEGIPVVQTLHNYRLICPGALLMRNGAVCEDCVGKRIPWPGVVYGCWRGSRAQTAVVAGMLTFHRLRGTWNAQVDRYIALTEFARRKFIEGGLPAEKIVVKPNFVHPDPGVGAHQGDYALFVGRLSQEKGVLTLLQAWKRLKGMQLKIAGDGPLIAEAQAFVAREDLDEVEFLGRRPREEIFELMREARVLVFPSEWYEGFPMTITEAFACGLPVIALRLGAMAEIVEDGRTGLLFEAGNPEDLVEKVARAWEHPREMARMGQNARQVYLENYTAEKNYLRLMEIYRKVMERHNGQ